MGSAKCRAQNYLSNFFGATKVASFLKYIHYIDFPSSSNGICISKLLSKS